MSLLLTAAQKALRTRAPSARPTPLGTTPPAPTPPRTRTPATGPGWEQPLPNPPKPVNDTPMRPATSLAGAPTAGAGGGALTTFGPGNDLRSTQVNPTTDARTAGTMSLVDQLRNAIGGAGSLRPTGGGGGAPGSQTAGINIDPSAEAQRARALTMQSLESLNSAPDRGAIALERLKLFDEETDPLYQQNLRQVGQKAAALGRVGAGMTTNELTDVFTTRERDRDRTKRALAADAADLEMQDRLSRVSAGAGVESSFGAGDRAQAGLALDKDNQGFSQRLAGAQFNQSSAAQAFNQALASRQLDLQTLGAMAGLEQQQFGQGLTRRNELRGERDYQQGMATDALNRRERQVGMADGLASSAQQRELAALAPLLNLGFSQNDLLPLLQSNAYAQDQRAADGNAGWMDLLSSWAQQQRSGAGG